MRHRLLIRTMSAWGRRYGIVGACIGLILPFFMSATLGGLVVNLIITPVYGVVVGAIFGSVCGAFDHWMKSNRRKADAQEGLHPTDDRNAASIIIKYELPLE